jgi:microcystin-dependent protein
MNPYVAEIRIFGFNFAPQGWASCDGQLLPLSQNTALFSLVGTFYGGNGTSNFALPDFSGRVPIHWGQGAGTTPRSIGESSGVESIQLLVSELPQHTHALESASSAGNRTTPANNAIARTSGATPYVAYNAGTAVNMAPTVVSTNGGGQPHNNLMPSLTLFFAIALQGIFPPRG